MRLLTIFNAFDTPNPGGVQVAGRIAWDAIARADPNAEALLISLEPHAASRSSARAISGAGRAGAVRAALRAAGPADIALFWHMDLLKLAPLLRLGRHCRKVLFLHGTEAWRPRGALARRQLRGFDAVFSNTSYTLRCAIAANPGIAALRTHIVQLGIGEPCAPPPPPHEVPIALMISRLHPDERYKGHDEVIAAWPLVRARIPDAQLWIVGDGALARPLELVAQHAGVADHVRFFGRVTEADKQVLLQRARCLLLPSTGEGFGLVYLEAMRLGRPSLVGVDGGYEVVNPPEAGLSVTQRTPQEIADATVRLLTINEAWQSWHTRARARYARDFTAAAFGARIVSALASVGR